MKWIAHFFVLDWSFMICWKLFPSKYDEILKCLEIKDLTRSYKILEDLLRVEKIYLDLTRFFQILVDLFIV